MPTVLRRPAEIPLVLGVLHQVEDDLRTLELQLSGGVRGRFEQQEFAAMMGELAVLREMRATPQPALYWERPRVWGDIQRVFPLAIRYWLASVPVEQWKGMTCILFRRWVHERACLGEKLGSLGFYCHLAVVMPWLIPSKLAGFFPMHEVKTKEGEP